MPSIPSNEGVECNEVTVDAALESGRSWTCEGLTEPCLTIIWWAHRPNNIKISAASVNLVSSCERVCVEPVPVLYFFSLSARLSPAMGKQPLYKSKRCS